MKNGKLTNSETAAFCSQIAVILKSGIAGIEGVTMMQEEADTARDRELLSRIEKTYRATGHLYEALTETQLFPDYMIALTRIGEETGNLDDVMAALADHYEQEETIRRSIRNAILYPLVMTGMMLAVIVILLVKVMPVFADVFSQLGTAMTGTALLLYDLGLFLRRYALAAALILAALLIFFLAVGLSEGRGSLRYRIGSHIGFIRRANWENDACRFAGGMAIALHSGIDPARSLELTEGLIDDAGFGEKIRACRKDVDNGTDLAASLKAHGIFSGVYARMAAIGSKSGSLDTVMADIADLYADDVDTRLGSLLAVIEPALIIILSVLVGGILLSVMFPLLGIMSSL